MSEMCCRIIWRYAFGSCAELGIPAMLSCIGTRRQYQAASQRIEEPQFPFSLAFPHRNILPSLRGVDCWKSDRRHIGIQSEKAVSVLEIAV
jgi:hypothetical protein